MNIRRVFMEIKVLKLFFVFAGVSTTVVLTIYYFTSDVTNLTLSPSVNYSTYPNSEQSLVRIPSIQRPQQQQHQYGPSYPRSAVIPEKYNEGELRNRLIRDKIKILTSNGAGATGRINKHDAAAANHDQFIQIAQMQTKNIHIFYSFPMHWTKMDSNSVNGTSLSPQTESSSLSKKPPIVFYPQLGLYQPEMKILQKHFADIKNLGIDVLIVKWSPLMPQYQWRFLLDMVGKGGLQVAIEIDAYPDRTPTSILNNLNYFYKEFWFHEAFYKVYVQSKKIMLPMVYIRDAHLISDNEWRKVLAFNGPISVRRSLYNAIFIGHISSKKHISLMRRSNFNGFYNRIASNGANYLSTWKNWAAIKKSADKYKLIFIPTLAPGYNEDKKQPKIGGQRRHRTNGQYFGVAWRTAISISAQFLAISSYNDWLAGTQIEEAIPKTGYRDYLPGGPTKYLDLTRHWVDEYIRTQNRVALNAVGRMECQRLFNNTIC